VSPFATLATPNGPPIAAAVGRLLALLVVVSPGRHVERHVIEDHTTPGTGHLASVVQRRYESNSAVGSETVLWSSGSVSASWVSLSSPTFQHPTGVGACWATVLNSTDGSRVLGVDLSKPALSSE